MSLKDSKRRLVDWVSPASQPLPKLLSQICNIALATTKAMADSRRSLTMADGIVIGHKVPGASQSAA